MLINQSNEITKKKRAFSAKAPSSKSRPLSGLTNRVNQKTQLIQGIYTHGASPIKKNKSKGLVFQGINTEELEKYKKQSTLVTTKNRQELFEENMSLKRQINRLQQELIKIKGRVEAGKRKVSQKSKQMDIQFQKEMYWAGSKSHLIAGIKYQYEKLKEQHSKKCREYDELKIALLQSKVPEYKIYAENVQLENRRLAEKLQKMMISTQSQLESMQFQKQKEVNEYMYLESEEKRKMLEKKLQEVDLKLKAANENITDKDKKIMFLEKLVIEKDNREYHAIQKVKKLEKGKDQLYEENKKMRHNFQKLVDQTEKKMSEMKENNNHEKYQERQEFQREIKNKNKIISELNAENKHLEGVINKLRLSASVAEVSQMKQPSVSKQTKASYFQELAGSINFEQVASQMKEKTQTKAQKVEIQEPAQRKQRTADKRHSQSAKKVRKIPYEQVEQIAELIQYRLIAANIDYKGIRDLFNYVENSEKSIEERQWDKEYISMKEVMQIFEEEPFSLESDNSQILARYIVEDANEEYVYCDLGNQHKRQIAKSTLRAVIGEYDLGDRNELEKQFTQILSKYSSNVRMALDRLYPGGKITSKRLLQIMGTIGVQAPKTFYTLLIAKLSAISLNLNELEFTKIFFETD